MSTIWRDTGLEQRSTILVGLMSMVTMPTGSYFARDASYSDKYSRTQRSLRRVMFVARVLVGEFVTGSSSYARPPSRTLGKGLYDSCVDRPADPSIFVVFEKHQIYPEYIIDYS